MPGYIPVQIHDASSDKDKGPSRSPSPRPFQGGVDRDGYGQGTRYDHLIPKVEQQQQSQEYRVYRRRFVGLTVLTLMTFWVSWAGEVFSPVAIDAIKYFQTDLDNINWLGTVGKLVYLPVCPLVIWVGTSHGPKFSVVVAAILMIVGVWVQFAGSYTRSFPTVFSAQVIHGIAQPFLISAPTSYSRLWFDQRSMTVATAIPSLALSIGAAIGSLATPRIIKQLDFSGVSLMVACCSTAVSLPALFIPRKPPTPASFIQEELKLTLKESLKMLPHLPPFYLQFFGFSVYVGAFQTSSTLVNTIVYRYGFSETEAGNAGAIMIFVGLGSAAIFSVIVDKTKKHLLLTKIIVPLIACTYTALIFIPQTHSLAGLYTIYALIGFTSYSIMPATLEFQANWTHPVNPVISSAICWMGGQLFSAIFIIVTDYGLILKRPEYGQPAGSAFPGLIFIAAMAWSTVPAIQLTGFWIFKKPAKAIEGRFG